MPSHTLTALTANVKKWLKTLKVTLSHSLAFFFLFWWGWGGGGGGTLTQAYTFLGNISGHIAA